MINFRQLNELIEKPISGEWGTECSGDGTHVLRTTNFTNIGKLVLDNVVKRSIPTKKVDSKKLLKGDIIIEKSGGSPNQPVGRVVFFNEEGLYLCNNFTSILRPKKEIVFPKYLLYQLFCNHCFGFTNRYQNKTTGIINLQLARYVEELKIPLPPLPVQQEIATILDTADALKQKDKALISKYDELTKSLFLDMFGDPVTNPKGWDISTLGEICQKITDGTHQSPKFLTEGIPFLLVSNIIDNEICYETNKYISIDEYYQLTKSTPIDVGDILYTSVGSYGKPAIVKKDKKFCFQRHLAHLKPNHGIVNNVFLHQMMISPLVKRQADRLARGVAQKTLNLREIKSMEVFLPSIDLQNQFAERIQSIERQKQQAQVSLQKSEDLFNCLLQKAFKGELVS